MAKANAIQGQAAARDGQCLLISVDSKARKIKPLQVRQESCGLEGHFTKIKSYRV